MSSSSTTNDINLRPYIVDLVHKVAKEEGFIDYTYTPAPGSKHADGFLGLILRITIKGQRNNKHKELSLIFKVPPESEIRRKEFLSDTVFHREIIAYDQCLTAIEKFQKDVNIPDAHGFFSYPKCYATVYGTGNDGYGIVMEDLREKGYDLWNKMETVKLDRVEMVVKELAKLHAISFAMRDQQPEVFSQFLSLNDVWGDFMSLESFGEMKDMSLDRAIASLKPDVDFEAVAKIKYLKENYLQLLRECTSTSDAEPFVVINHGDSWSNNLMFTYKEDGQLDKVCFIDWQIVRAASPVLDLVYFLFTTTHKPLRDAHYSDIIRTYYDTLAGTIRACGSDPDKLFTFNDLQDHLKKFGKYALIMAVFLLQSISMDAKDIPDIDEMVESMATKDTSKYDHVFEANANAFNVRMRDVILDCLDLGYM